jgi:hypothetical protein
VNEGNNLRYVSICIGPDLVVTSISAPTSAKAGSTITVTDTTANQGGGGAAPSVTRYYLSTDSSGDVPVTAVRGRAGAQRHERRLRGSAIRPALRHPLLVVSLTMAVVVETVETNNNWFRSRRASASQPEFEDVRMGGVRT